MSSIAHIPLVDTAPEGSYEPRRLTFRAPPMKRRGFLRTIGLGGMALGITAVSWIPIGRSAYATVGTEYTDCGGYSYDNIVCTGAPYSSAYCGTDKWFKNGCWRDPAGGYNCYSPTAACGNNRTKRNAWRWRHGSYVFRCADGYYKYTYDERVFRICSAALYAV